jgi:DNA polymerase (family X)
MDLDHASTIANQLIKCIRSKRPASIQIVGSIRRKKAKIKDIDYLIVMNNLSNTDIDLYLPSHLEMQGTKVLSWGTRKKSIKIGKMKIDMFFCTKKEYPFALFHYTGSDNYNIRIRKYAKNKGLILNQYGIFDKQTQKKAKGSDKIKNESHLASYLGVSIRKPEDR